MDKINKFLLNKGVSNLSQITAIKLLPEIPLLGSGKVDYKTLREKIILEQGA